MAVLLRCVCALAILAQGCSPGQTSQQPEAGGAQSAQPQVAQPTSDSPDPSPLVAGLGTEIPRLGRHHVGAPASEVIKTSRQTDVCKEGLEIIGCLAISQEEIEYAFLYDEVISITVKAGTAAAAQPMPFGLDFDDTLAEVISKLGAKSRRPWWLVGNRDGVTITSWDTYLDRDGGEGFYIELLVANSGALQQVIYTVGAI